MVHENITNDKDINKYSYQAPPLPKEGLGEECENSSNRRFTTAAYTPETNSINSFCEAKRNTFYKLLTFFKVCAERRGVMFG